MALIRRLTLTNFRNYRSASVEPGDARTIVLCGPNGAGKTNLIEAISFLAPGRGLRRATLDEVAFQEGDGSWAVAAEIEMQRAGGMSGGKFAVLADVDEKVLFA